MRERKKRSRDGGECEEESGKIWGRERRERVEMGERVRKRVGRYGGEKEERG